MLTIQCDQHTDYDGTTAPEYECAACRCLRAFQLDCAPADVAGHLQDALALGVLRVATQPAPTETEPIRGQSKGFCNWCNLDPAEHARLGCVHPWEQPAEPAPTETGPEDDEPDSVASLVADAISAEQLAEAAPQGAPREPGCTCSAPFEYHASWCPVSLVR